MIPKLKRKLILIYTVSTSLILTVCMCFAYHLYIVSQQKNIIENLLLTADSFISKLQSGNMINLSELDTLENSKHMLIQITDQGYPLSRSHSYQPPTDIDVLMKHLEESAILEGMHLSHPLSAQGIQRTSVVTVEGMHHDKYYGYAVILPNNESYFTLTILCSQDSPQTPANTCFYILVTLLGTACFFSLSFLLIQKVLNPVQENQKRQIEFVASASHELRSPLAYIQTAASELMIDCYPKLTDDSAASLSNYVHNTQEECSRMSQLIEDMLLLACADRKTWTLNIQPIDCDNFFITSYDTLSYLCNQRGHTLELSLPDALLGTQFIDHHRIYQVLQILIHNAVSYTPSDQTITIAPSLEKKQLMIQVIDHGPGIKDEEKSRVFERYYRSDPSRTERNHFGLGLSIAKELAALHHGELTLQDTLGGGCTFILTIPLIH